MNSRAVWTGPEWEQHINGLLSLRYPPGDFQRVPAEHGGDCGVEGFSRSDGCAYQCYAPSEPVAVRELHKRQRTKMTDDIAKFIKNKTRLAEIFGRTKIRRWLLVVPEHRSARMVAHCSVKTNDVLAAHLPYVTDDFTVGIITDDEFAIEKRAMAAQGAAYVRLAIVDLDPVEIELHAHKDPVGIANLRRKLGIALADRSESELEAVTSRMVHAYLVGQSHLDRLNKSYPEVYAELLKVFAQAERKISLESMLTPMPAADFLYKQFESLSERLVREVRSAEPIADDLVQQTVADWLMRCPLNFRDRGPAASAPAELVS